MSQSSAIMNGKRGLIMGVANDRSIAWGIAAQAAAAGAELAFTYQGDALKKRVGPLANSRSIHKGPSEDFQEAGDSKCRQFLANSL